MMKALSLLLLVSLLLGLCGCGSQAEPEDVLATLPPQISPMSCVDLLSGLSPRTVEARTPDTALSAAMGEFAVSLLQHSFTAGENTVLSPYSLYLALSMAANGADGDTLAQMEAILGLPVPALNAYLLSLQKQGGKELLSANSLWIRQDFPVKEDFLQSLADHYETQAYSAPFTDSTLEEINRWIEGKTDGQIPGALDKIDPDAMMYLINALSFRGAWKSPYSTDRIMDGTFLGSRGEETAEFMGAKEGIYLEDALATGFMKEYEGGRYSFLALLPNEGVSLEDYIASLSGDSLSRTLAQAQYCSVNTMVPKLRLECSLEAAEVLDAMGMKEAFTMNADFSRIEPEKLLYISRILHKTTLTVDEAGTEAGAVTVEEFALKNSPMREKSVVLNRPFLMGIYDNVNHCFLFLSAVETLS